MEGLSFTVRHGDLIWQVAAGLFALAGLGLPRVRLRRRWQRGRARALDAVGEPTLPEADADAVLDGTLEVEESLEVLGQPVAAATLVAERGDDELGGPVHRARAGRLVLVTDHGRFRLEGDVEVQAGSWERWTGRPLLASKLHTAVGMESPVSLNLKAGLRAVTAGAKVRMRGRVTQVAEPPSEREGDYRQAATRWVVSGEETPIVLVAAQADRLQGPGWPARVGAMVLAALAFLVVFGGGGLVAKELDAEWAAATPFHREDGLRMARRRLEEAVADDPAAVAPYVEVSRMLGDGIGPVFTLVQQGYLEEAEPIARAHGRFHDLTRIATEWARRGRFSRASDVAETAMERMLEQPEPIFGFVLRHDVVPLHVFAGRFDRAAEAMGHAVELEATDELPADVNSRAYRQRQRAKGRCYAAYLSHLAGDAGASARMADLIDGPARAHCTHLHALTFPPHERAEAILACDDCGESSFPPQLLTLLAYEGLGCADAGDEPRCRSLARRIHDDRLRFVEAEDLLLDPTSWLHRIHPGVDRRILEQLRSHRQPLLHQRLVRVSLATMQGVLFGITGASDEATSELEAALDDRRVLVAAAREEAKAESGDEVDEEAGGPQAPRPIDHQELRDQLFSLQAMLSMLARDWEAARKHLEARREPAPEQKAMLRILDPKAPLPEDLASALPGRIDDARRPALAAALRDGVVPKELDIVYHRERILLSTRLGTQVPSLGSHLVVSGVAGTLSNGVVMFHRARLRGEEQLEKRARALLDAVRGAALAPGVTEALAAKP